MITSLTRTKLCDFLLRAADEERRIENMRQIVNEHTLFEPYAAFRRIATFGCDFITADDLHSFLVDNSVLKPTHNLQKLIRHYSERSTQRITYNEFMRIVLSWNNADLRTAAALRPNYEVHRFERLSSSLEEVLSKLISKEADFYDTLYAPFRDLALRPDYNPLGLFREIQRTWENSINFNSLRTFYSQQGLVPFEHEIIEVLRRVDKDDDGSVSFVEFDEFLLLCDSAFARPVAMRRSGSRPSSPIRVAHEDYLARSPSRRTSPLRMRYNRTLDASSISRRSGSPYRSGILKASPSRKYLSPVRDYSRRRGSASKLRRSRENLKYSSYVAAPKNKNFTFSSRAIRNSTLSHYSTLSKTTRIWSLKEELSSYFRVSTRLENEIDLLKQELCYRNDFNALDNFRLIDALGKSQVRQDELSSFLVNLDPTITASKCSAIFRRLDTDNDGFISYSDFLNAVIPLDEQFERLINSRTPANHLNEFNLNQLFSLKTKDCMRNLFHMIADAELQLRDLRVAIPNRREELFSLLDISCSGELTKQELARFCELNDLILSTQEIELLFRRLDKNEDELLDYTDFIKEMGI